ncbi:MAG: hypothetical protein M1828_002892 [Chrysothrix sp. TS-e1954]|nr:MAG: hypothetical protein M1828_002892 [Chrysothrix sp. TS-e1954]
MSNQSYYNNYPPEKHTYDSSQAPAEASSSSHHKHAATQRDPDLPDLPPPSYEDARGAPGMSGPPPMTSKKGAAPDEDERGFGATVAGGTAGGALGHGSGHTMSGAAIGAVGANVAEHFMHRPNQQHQQQPPPQQQQQQPYPPMAGYGQMPPGPGYGPPPPGAYGMPPPQGQQPLYGKYAYKAQKEQMKMERKQAKHGPRR